MLGMNAVSSADAILSAEIFTPSCLFFMALAFMLSFWRFRSYDWCDKVSPYRVAVAFVIFVVAVLALFTQSYNPFLYFQF